MKSIGVYYIQFIYLRNIYPWPSMAHKDPTLSSQQRFQRALLQFPRLAKDACQSNGATTVSFFSTSPYAGIPQWSIMLGKVRYRPTLTHFGP